MTAIAAVLPDGRLHLQHGPIDCVCQAWGPASEVTAAYRQGAAFFASVLDTLCAELPLLRSALPAPRPDGAVAAAMHDACLPFSDRFITPMAAVAGAVADAVLAAMTRNRSVSRAFVNNGGDIAFHLEPHARLHCGLVSNLASPGLDGTFMLEARSPARGIATSGRACKGRGGKSFSLGIADSVTVLAPTAAQADAAATMLGNAVDLPGHPAILRRPARDIDPANDLGDRLVTLDVGPLPAGAVRAALDTGDRLAETLLRRGLITGAVLALRGQFRVRHAPLVPQEVA